MFLGGKKSLIVCQIFSPLRIHQYLCAFKRFENSELHPVSYDCVQDWNQNWVDILPILVSIFEVTALKSIYLPLKVGKSVADLSTTTHLRNSFTRTNLLLDVNKYIWTCCIVSLVLLSDWIYCWAVCISSTVISNEFEESHQLCELLSSVNIGSLAFTVRLN